MACKFGSVFLTVSVSVLLLLPACSTRSSQADSLEQRLAALEDAQYNFQARQESLNSWEANRLAQLEAKHPDIKVPAPPQFMARESVPTPSQPTQDEPAQGEVIESLPGEARIEPAVVKPPAAQAESSAQQPKSVIVYPAPPGKVKILKAGEASPNAPVHPAHTLKSTQHPVQPPVTPASPAQTEQSVQADQPNQTAQTTQPVQANSTEGRAEPNVPAAPLKGNQAGQLNQADRPDQADPDDRPGRTNQAEAVKPAPSGEKGEYASALSLVERGKNADGRAAMDSFIEKYPSSALIPNALYWKGETYYGERDYSEAILVFRDVAARFPSNAKAADAMLKIGMSYQRMDDAQNAKFYLQQLIDDYPNSRSAGLAKKLLTSLP